MDNINCGRILKTCAVLIICVIGLASLFIMSEISGMLGFMALVGGAFCGLLLYAFGDISDNTVRIRELLEENNKKGNVVKDCSSGSASVEKDATSNNTEHIWWCSKCGMTFSTSKVRANHKCFSCYSQLTETSILTADWRKKSQEMKDALKEAFKKGEYLKTNTETDNPAAINVGSAAADESVGKNEKLSVNTNELVFAKRDCTVLTGVSVEASNKESIALPYYVTTIESDAFVNCTNLKVVDLNNVKQIGDGAFRNCPNLSDVYINHMESGLFENAALPTGCTIHEGRPEA